MGDGEGEENSLPVSAPQCWWGGVGRADSCLINHPLINHGLCALKPSFSQFCVYSFLQSLTGQSWCNVSIMSLCLQRAWLIKASQMLWVMFSLK